MAFDIVKSIRDESVFSEELSNNQDVVSYIIPQGVEIPMPEAVFELSSIPVFTKRSISLLIGKAKAGKTTLTAWIVAQCLVSGMKVSWIDTEQGLYYGSRSQYWVLSIAGMSRCENLKYYDLKILTPEDRRNVIEACMLQDKPDLLIIDGVKDLVYDINSPEEATIVSGQTMKWAEEGNCHVMCALHQNKADKNARGHTGAEFTNKSETVISVTKGERGEVICEPEFTRSEPFQAFTLERDSYGIPQLSESQYEVGSSYTGRRSIQPSNYTLEMHRNVLSKVFQDRPDISYRELIPSIISAYGLHDIVFGEKKSESFISHLSLVGIITSRKEGKYTMYSMI